MAKPSEDASRRLQTIQITAALYSILFVSFITYGYVVLLQGNAGYWSYVIGIILAIIAWLLARFIGSDEGGISRYLPLFALLLTISALGVFNTMFATFESKNILIESVDKSYARFSQIQGAVSKAQDEAGITERSASINTALNQLTDEIKNPINCGQGPRAMDAIRQLSGLLPGFSALSQGASNGCAEASALIAAYTDKVTELKKTAAWNDRDLQAAAADASVGLMKLQDTKTKISSGPRAISQVKSDLEMLAPIYAGHVSKLSAAQKIEGVPPSLDLRQIESIGEWSQLINLILGRWDKPSTYFYLLVAVFADWMMVYLFALVRENRGTAPSGTTRNQIKSAW
jgi:hypothetical protein